jgi:GT2 family glycosyltransferase
MMMNEPATPAALPASTYAAIVLYFRRGADFRKTIDDLLSQDLAAEEILVVDNCSNDMVVETLNFASPAISTYFLQQNLGYAGGMNAGYSLLSGATEYVLFMTHEVRLESSSIRALVEYADTHDCSIAGPQLLLADTQEIWSSGGAFRRSGMTTHRTRSVPESLQGHAVDWLDGSVLLVRRSVFEQIGKFDESFFLYWEDVDICTRAALYGEVSVVRLAHATQDTGMSPPYYEARNAVLYWKKNRNYAKVFTVAFAQFLKVARRCVRRQRLDLSSKARILGVYDGIAGKLNIQRGAMR